MEDVLVKENTELLSHPADTTISSLYILYIFIELKKKRKKKEKSISALQNKPISN